MIVTFKSKASGDVIYFKEIALKLLQMMQRDDKVPSALYAEDVPAALVALQQALAAVAEEERQKVVQSEQREERAKPYISLITRAEPLLNLLQKAQKKQCPVMWE